MDIEYGRILEAVFALVTPRLDADQKRDAGGWGALWAGEWEIAAESLVAVCAHDKVPLRESEIAGLAVLAEWSRLDSSYHGPLDWVELIPVVPDIPGMPVFLPHSRAPFAPGIRPTMAATCGGGHRPRTGMPGKTEFPHHWNEDQVAAFINDIAARPPDGQMVSLPNGLVHAWDTRGHARLHVVSDSAGPVTAFPEWGPGVVKNPTDLARPEGLAWEQYLFELEAFTEALEDRTAPWQNSIRVFFAAGEWPLCLETSIAALRANNAIMDETEGIWLDNLTRRTGAPLPSDPR